MLGWIANLDWAAGDSGAAPAPSAAVVGRITNISDLIWRPTIIVGLMGLSLLLW